MADEVDIEVEKFYTDHPFPDFDLEKYEEKEQLRERASWYFQLLNTFIPKDASVIEVGCGTGQLVNFLALESERSVVGMDLTPASLRKAAALRDKFELTNLELVNRNIFDDLSDLGPFQYVFCNGVLHHTRDTYRAFKSILNLVAPGGFLIVGYYNRYARIPLYIERSAVRKSKKYSISEKKSILSRHYTIGDFDDMQIDSWFHDQFLHPHEETVSVSRALEWFSDNEFEYINSFPHIEIGRSLRNAHLPHLQRDPFLALNEKSWKYSFLPLLLVQLYWMLQKRNEGGYYTLIGRKRKV